MFIFVCFYFIFFLHLPSQMQAPLFQTSFDRLQFSPHPGWRIIVLNSYEQSALGWSDANETGNIEAWKLIDENNINNCHDGTANWIQGLPNELQRFVPYNGALGLCFPSPQGIHSLYFA
jgi:hypothetical protein